MDGNAEYLTIESAGNVAGIPARTLRYWVRGGKLVKLADVLAIAELTGKLPAAGRQPGGNIGNPARSAAGNAGNIADPGNVVGAIEFADPADETDVLVGSAPVVSSAARSQLEAIRDEWLAPLIAQIREQAELIGRLGAEREAAIRERDDLAARLAGDRALADQLVDVLQAERDALAARVRDLGAGVVIDPVLGPQEAPPEAPGASQPADVAPDTSSPAPSRWAAWWRRVVGGG